MRVIPLNSILRGKLPLAVCVIAAATVAIWLAIHPPRDRRQSEDPLDFVLNERVNAWPWETVTTLDAAIAGVSKANHIHIVIDWPELEAAGVSRSQRQYVLWSGDGIDGSLGPLIHALVQAFSQNPTRAELAPPVRFSLTPDGALFVTIDHDAQGRLRIYDVRDLLTDQFWGTPADPASADAFRKDHEKTLSDLVINRLHATDYALSPTGYILDLDRIDCLHGRLLVVTTPARHRHLERILAALRRMNAGGLPEKLRLP
jgi:hypothetical protein